MSTASRYTYLLLLLACVGVCLGADAHPAATASDWSTNSKGAYAAVMAQLQNLLTVHAQYQAAVSWTTWIIAAGGLLVTFAKLFPGPTGVAFNLAWDLFAPKFLKAQEAKQAVLAQGFHSVAEIMKSFPKDSPLGSVIDKLQSDLPEPVKQAYREWEKSDISPDRPPTTQELVNTARIQAIAALSAAKEVIENPPSIATPPQPAVLPNAPQA